MMEENKGLELMIPPLLWLPYVMRALLEEFKMCYVQDLLWSE